MSTPAPLPAPLPQPDAEATIREANARIAALERSRVVLIGTLAALPLTLMALLVLILSQPLAPPGPTLSLAAAVIGALMTGALFALGAHATAALLDRTSRSGRADPAI